MTTAELFNDPVEDVLHLPEIDPNKNYFEELVGEGKKFKDQAALAISTVHKDRHIAKLESELKAIRTDMNSRLSLEELVTKLATAKPSESGNPVVDDSSSNQNESTTLTPETLAKIVDERVAQISAREAAKSNLNVVKSTLTAAWGKDYPNKLREKAQELGVGESFLNDLAASQPKAFLKLIEVEPSSNTQVRDNGTPIRGTNIPAQPTPDPNFKGRSYYNKLRRENPSQFWDSRTQIEMNAMAMKDPDRFTAS